MDDRHIRWVLRKITVLMWKSQRPTYLGELSMEAGVGLERTELLVDYLCEMGVMRYMTRQEKHDLGLDTRGAILILIDESLVPHIER